MTLWTGDRFFVKRFRFCVFFAVLASGVAVARAAQPRELVMSNAALRVRLELPSGRLTVTDQRVGIVWRQYVPARSARGSAWGKVKVQKIPAARLVQLTRATQHDNTFRAQANWNGHPFDITYELSADAPQLTVTIDTSDRNRRLPWKPGWAGVTMMIYPYAFVNDEAGSELAVPIDEGVLWSIYDTDPKSDYRRWNSWWLHQRLSMPWWGATDGRRGVMTEVETPFDCLFSVNWVETPSGERTLPHITWLDSKRTWAYPRRVTFRFFADGGYVAMAKAFRRAEQARGTFRSWTEKVRANPAVARLRGALDVWHQQELTQQLIEALKEAGVRNAIVAKPRGGNAAATEGITPGAIRAAVQAGYLIGGYHNFTWIQGRWVKADPSLKEAAVVPASGKLKWIKNAWDPLGRLDRCPAAHRDVFVRRAREAREPA
ncbi:MAG: hypothetical protein GXP27_10150 [Planctomycetes bacterium]|nr:hypothetical protein [Planctomycetota bacterium]